MAAAIGVLWNQTLFNRPVFIAISVFVSAWLSILIGRRWKSLSGINTSIINIIIGALIICVSGAGAFLTTNFIGVDRSVVQQRDVVIADRSQATRYKTRRVSRKVYARGAPYKVYFVTLDIPSVGKRKMEVTKSVYDRVRSNDTASIAISRGMLGWPVIITDSIRPKHPHPQGHKSQRRCRFFGTSSKD